LLKKEIEQIKDKNLRKMTEFFIQKYSKGMEKIPCSLSGQFHKMEDTAEEHLKRTFWFAKQICREFNIDKDNTDILLTSALLHDVANYKFITKKRSKNQFQKLYSSGWHRSNEAFFYHPVLGMFMIGKYMLDNNLLDPKIIKVALAVSTHMEHWFKDFCPVPRNDLEKFLALSDYFASRDIKIQEEKI